MSPLASWLLVGGILVAVGVACWLFWAADLYDLDGPEASDDLWEEFEMAELGILGGPDGD